MPIANCGSKSGDISIGKDGAVAILGRVFNGDYEKYPHPMKSIVENTIRHILKIRPAILEAHGLKDRYTDFKLVE